MKPSLLAAEQLGSMLKIRGVRVTIVDVPENEQMAKVSIPAGNICIYSNKKGELRYDTSELAEDQRHRVETAIQDMASLKKEARSELVAPKAEEPQIS